MKNNDSPLLQVQYFSFWVCCLSSQSPLHWKSVEILSETSRGVEFGLVKLQSILFMQLVFTYYFYHLLTVVVFHKDIHFKTVKINITLFLKSLLLLLPKA